VAENQYKGKRLKQQDLLKARSEPLFLNPNAKKASGYNLITGQILKELPELDLNYLTQLFNESFPPQWKVAQVIMIPKSNNDPVDVKSYRAINLLLVISKSFEKLLLQKLMRRIKTKKNRLIPNYQLGFLNKYAS